MGLREVVADLPYPLKQPIRYIYSCIPVPLRYGQVFRETYALLQESQWWSREKLEEYQMQQLTRLLNYVYEAVPYYRQVFDERGLKPKDIQNFDDLRKLPYLTKDDVRGNFNALMAKSLPKSRFEYTTTSGSTGIPLWFYMQRGVTIPREMAFHAHLRNRVGYSFGDKCVVLRGNVVKRFEGGKQAWWEYTPIDNLLILSAFHMTEENMFQYVKRINEFQPQFIQAYPSVIITLARFMQEKAMGPIPSIKAILCASENLYVAQREMLEAVFRCRIFSWYGHAEMLVLAGECEKDSRYHVFGEYGVTELVRSDDSPVEHEDEIGEIVGTGFNNYAMPFIRYKTGDLATFTQEGCPCGRNYPLLKNVEGRLQEFLVGKDGQLIPLGAMLIAFIFDNVKQFQFYQDEPGKALLHIVKREAYTEQDTGRIRKTLNQMFGERIELTLRFVDNIPLPQSGKYRFLIQRLPIESWDSGKEK